MDVCGGYVDMRQYTLGSQKRVSSLLELELQEVGSPPVVGTGNQMGSLQYMHMRC